MSASSSAQRHGHRVRQPALGEPDDGRALLARGRKDGSASITPEYRGQLGKQANCQVAVTLSIAKVMPACRSPIDCIYCGRDQQYAAPRRGAYSTCEPQIALEQISLLWWRAFPWRGADGRQLGLSKAGKLVGRPPQPSASVSLPRSTAERRVPPNVRFPRRIAPPHRYFCLRKLKR